MAGRQTTMLIAVGSDRLVDQTELDSGGTDVTGGAFTVAATPLHEMLETIADPHVNLWAPGPHGYVISQEGVIRSRMAATQSELSR
jgi:hypothetical protein